MIKSKFDEDNIIHKTYKKSRLIVFILFLFVICFMSVGYAALNSILEVVGYVNLNGEVGDLEIISIDVLDNAVNGTSYDTSFYISSSSNDDSVSLVAEFDMNFYRTMGSSNSAISYDVVIKNNSLTERKLVTVNSSPTFNSGSSTLNYSMSGISFLTTVISPGDSVTVTLTFSLGQFERYTTYNVYEVFEFVFSEVTEDDFKLNPLLTTTSVEFSTFDDIVAVSVGVSNISAQNITYVFEIDNSNFEIVDSTGVELSPFTVSAYTTASSTFYLKVSDYHMFSELTDVISVDLVTTSPTILTYSLGDINVTVPKDKVQDILGDETIVDDDTIDFTTVATSSGLYKNSSSGEITYFYRGNVSNNYVSFANHTWRIIKIDKYGVRIILDDVIDSTAVWASSNVVSDLSGANSTLSYTQSGVKKVIEDWYNSELSSYSDIIEDSIFCEDLSYQLTTSSSSGYSTYYFGPYVRNGKDSSGYTPEFACDSEYIKKYKIGLISADEIAFAGGLFNTASYNYYLYNSNITSYWWTLSPSYYDTGKGEVGIFVVDGSTGNYTDWQNEDTVENANSIRPVITLDTDMLSGGSGIMGDEYTFGL